MPITTTEESIERTSIKNNMREEKYTIQQEGREIYNTIHKGRNKIMMRKAIGKGQ